MLASDSIENPATGERVTFVSETPDLLVMETVWPRPRRRTAEHVHPAMEERFTVHEGRCQFLSGRRWIEAGPGETVVVPAGTRHAFRNRGDVETRIECEATPPSTLQAFLEDVAGLSRAGKLTRVGLPKPGGLLEAAVLTERYQDMVTLLFPAPPRPVQRLVFGPLARIAERRGLRAGQFAELA